MAIRLTLNSSLRTEPKLTKFLAAARMVLGDIKQLETPAVATAVAGILAPVIASVVGVNVTAAEVGLDLMIAGAVAAVLQKLLTAQPQPAPKPTPVEKAAGK